MADSTEYGFLVDAGLGSVSAVVSSLPVGYTLGQTRVVLNSTGAIKYKLVHNAGNSQISQGMVASPAAGSVGPYSVTVSTASKSNMHIGAAICVNVTATTGTYFWGAVNGRVGGLLADVTSIPTGSALYIAANGSVELMPQSVVTGNTPIGINLGASATKTVTTGTLSGDCYVVIEQ
jgi:hypothetical protein